MQTIGSTFQARHQNGFTLIEVLIVTVIIGILAAIAIPKFSATKERAYWATMKTDLRNLITAEEEYFSDNMTYTSDKSAAGLDFNESTGVTVTVTITASPMAGYSATAVHPSTAKSCAVFVNTAAVAPALNEGEPKCI